MDFKVECGLKSKENKIVTDEMLASKFGSGNINVLATPVMIGLIEEASLKAVDPELPEGYATVGYNVNVAHMAPTPPKMEVRAEARLKEVENRKLTFKVEVFDEKEKVGEGYHTRFIVNTENLQDKAEAKK